MTDEKRDPPLPKASPTPKYEEKLHISKMDTGSVKFEDVVHELKRQAKLRLRRWLAAGSIGLTGLGAGGGGLLTCDGEKKRAERAEERARKAEQLERRLTCIGAQLPNHCEKTP